LGVPNDIEHRQVKIILSDGRKIIVDGFDESSKTIYEFWGCYFHGHPEYFNSDDICEVNGKKFGELYSETVKKIDSIKNSGYNLIDVWAHKTKSGTVKLVPKPKELLNE
jgi:hypothetical protein